MKRLILLTFGFLGWAFYEMSGGADFEPMSARMATVEPAEPAPPAEVMAEPVVATAQQSIQITKSVPTAAPKPTLKPAPIPTRSVPEDTTPPGFEDDAVTRVALDLTSLNNALGAVDGPDDGASDELSLVPVSSGSTTSSVDTPAIIPSLIVSNDAGGAAQASVTSSGADIRSVSGSRVNVRGGPGTEFEVVTKLGRGDAVEILQDNGAGWVLMRPLDGGPEGWMADFLLTDG